ncbi:MAG: hypothetical protein MUF42_15395 [Cytophagaceae bacterium]|jgi:hypothetical protein|nr:hypothetical protein [Cytophagaceae bacterium]
MKTTFIAHRVNTIAELKNIPTAYGIELDLRDYHDSLVLQHDPMKGGELFENYLEAYKHGTLILNIKSERIEWKVLEMIQAYGIRDYFFLDSSFPMIHAMAQKGERNIALRFSEWEGLDTLEQMRGRVDWVWVDCFTHLPLNAEVANQMRAWGYKICLVSPELQGRDADIECHAQQLRELQIAPDAICTKVYNINRWKKLLEIK